VRKKFGDSALVQHFIVRSLSVRWGSEEGFRIWAILSSGTRWVARIDGGRLQSSAAPDRLIIHLSAPGNLIISRGDNLITTLLNGRLEAHGFDIYEARWLQKSQEDFEQWAIRECFRDHDIGAIVESDFVNILGENFTRLINTLPLAACRSVPHTPHARTFTSNLAGTCLWDCHILDLEWLTELAPGTSFPENQSAS
jgi:hypothetical protein